MGEKESKNGGGEKKKKGDGGKKNDDSITVVLKVDMHCEGCAQKITTSVRRFEGVEQVKGDSETNKLTVVGKVDPAKLREKVEQKTKKKVELISPLPKKEKEGGGGDKKSEDKPEEKKAKEAPVTTAVLKVSSLHCEGCIKKIRRTVSKTKGVIDMAIDRQKDLVTVKGTMDAKALAEGLKERFRRPVEIVPPKKDGGGKEKEKEKGGGEKEKGGGEGKAAGGGGDGGKKEEGGKAEGNKMDYYGPGYGNGYGPGYGPGYVVEMLHPPQMFSDENPNACSVM